MQNDFNAVPVIDVGALAAPDSAAYDQLCYDLGQAYSTVGFGYIQNHGVSNELIDGMIEATRAFHALPMAEKMKIELNQNHRGFIPVRSATDVHSEIEVAQRPNHSESFIMMREADQQDPDVLAGVFLSGSNQWPANMPGFRERAIKYHYSLSRVARRLLQALFRSIGTDFIELKAHFDPPTTFLRLLHYPERKTDSPLDSYGSAPHVDFGCITLLIQDQCGLQVQGPTGDWFHVRPVPNTFVMNVGTMLRRWSNGLLRSTAHRVINESGRSRFSVAFFYDPHMNTKIAPLKSCVSKDHPLCFEPVVYSDFVRDQLQATYIHHQLHGDQDT
jgi:isopenicillin N synthase-like dioxygenase